MKNCDNSAVDLKYYEIYHPRYILEFFLKVIILNIEKIACEGCFVTWKEEQSTSEETGGSLELPVPGADTPRSRHSLESAEPPERRRGGCTD